MPKKKDQPTHSCANCKHQFRLNRDASECRRFPMTYVPELDVWVSPPAPDDFLCGEHLIRCNS